jgi:hypothetical protein
LGPAFTTDVPQTRSDTVSPLTYPQLLDLVVGRKGQANFIVQKLNYW